MSRRDRAGSLAEPQSTEASEISEVIIVTGSYIRGTAEDAALPVDVLTSDDLTKQGSPSMPDLIKSIPAVQGVMGESNQFGAGQSTGGLVEDSGSVSESEQARKRTG